MQRRSFIQASAAATSLLSVGALAHDQSDDPAGREHGTALVWPMVSPASEFPVLNGHTDTIPDIVGRLGSPIGLAIFTEGNHFPALLGGGIIDGFRAWARRRPEFAALPLDNIVIVTLPQPMIVRMLLGRGISFGNLTLDVSRTSGFYPDIVMAGTAPLRTLRKASILDAEAHVFARNRGLALVTAAGDPLGIRSLEALDRPDVRVVLASDSEAGARQQYISALEGLLGQPRTQAVLSRETLTFPGRLGIQHRDIPQAIAARAADVGIIFHHLAQYYAAAYPQFCAAITVPGAEQFSSTIAMASASDPLRPAAAKAFSQYFLEAAREVYPRHGFAMMSAPEFGATIKLE